jgi:hypothetical protein
MLRREKCQHEIRAGRARGVTHSDRNVEVWRVFMPADGTRAAASSITGDFGTPRIGSSARCYKGTVTIKSPCWHKLCRQLLDVIRMAVPLPAKRSTISEAPAELDLTGGLGAQVWLAGNCDPDA